MRQTTDFVYMLVALKLLTSASLSVLFVGNSLLNVNDVPGSVANLLQSDGTGTKVTYRSYFVGHLEDVPPGSEIDRQVTGGGYRVVVLQGAMVSSSLSRTYSQARAITMAKAAKRAGSRVMLYVEWPRRGIDETEYTMNVYRGIAKESGAEIIPVGYAWNQAVKRFPQVKLWNGDGNHALPTGSLVAAFATYFAIAGTDRTPDRKPSGVDSGFAAGVLEIARKVAKG